MLLFLDTSNLELIKRYAEYGVVDGITTNPTNMAKEGISDPEKRIREIAEVIPWPISCEVTTLTAPEMIEQARKIVTWGNNMVVKLPIIPEGIKALKVLSSEGINTNMTLCFSVTQAWIVAKLGATYVSPFVSRLEKVWEDGIKLIEDIVKVYQNYEYATQIISASVHSYDHIRRTALAGADITTFVPELFDEILQHDLTDEGVKKFMDDFNKVKTS